MSLDHIEHAKRSPSHWQAAERENPIDRHYMAESD
jgi:hypothetical protein